MKTVDAIICLKLAFYRDFIRHVAALNKLEASKVGIKAYNLGTGRGVSVLELINVFEKTNGVEVPYVFEARRQGDISSMYADA